MNIDDRLKTTILIRYFPEDLVSSFLAHGWKHPDDFIGKSIKDVFQILGSDHTALCDFLKAMWSMGLHFDRNGVIQTHIKKVENSDELDQQFNSCFDGYGDQ